MKNPYLSQLIREVAYTEGMQVVADPKVLDLRKFIDEVIEEGCQIRLFLIYRKELPQILHRKSSGLVQPSHELFSVDL